MSVSFIFATKMMGHAIWFNRFKNKVSRGLNRMHVSIIARLIGIPHAGNQARVATTNASTPVRKVG